ncbi:MAG: hypothetical protein KJ698_05835 [Actinobacteria bacterium]|nr:hypothetical protein [Actinomycetota bacterium]MBU1494601.1 hypothetical protein [Actinomycetota bacterium]
MMAFTTYTGAIYFRDARKHRFPRPGARRLLQPSAPTLGRTGDRERRLVTESAAMR